MVMNVPTLAMWLYGPMGVGVLAGVDVSTLGVMVAPCVLIAFYPAVFENHLCR